MAEISFVVFTTQESVQQFLSFRSCFRSKGEQGGIELFCQSFSFGLRRVEIWEKCLKCLAGKWFGIFRGVQMFLSGKVDGSSGVRLLKDSQKSRCVDMVSVRIASFGTPESVVLHSNEFECSNRSKETKKPVNRNKNLCWISALRCTLICPHRYSLIVGF